MIYFNVPYTRDERYISDLFLEYLPSSVLELSLIRINPNSERRGILKYYNNYIELHFYPLMFAYKGELFPYSSSGDFYMHEVEEWQPTVDELSGLKMLTAYRTRVYKIQSKTFRFSGVMDTVNNVWVETMANRALSYVKDGLAQEEIHNG